jgi:hypothetical protein
MRDEYVEVSATKSQRLLFADLLIAVSKLGSSTKVSAYDLIMALAKIIGYAIASTPPLHASAHKLCLLEMIQEHIKLGEKEYLENKSKLRMH